MEKLILCSKSSCTVAHQYGLRSPLGQALHLRCEKPFPSSRQAAEVEAQRHREPNADHVVEPPDPVAVVPARCCSPAVSSTAPPPSPRRPADSVGVRVGVDVEVADVDAFVCRVSLEAQVDAAAAAAAAAIGGVTVSVAVIVTGVVVLAGSLGLRFVVLVVLSMSCTAVVGLLLWNGVGRLLD